MKPIQRFLLVFLIISGYQCQTKNPAEDNSYIIKNFSSKDIPEIIQLEGKKYGFQELLNPYRILWEGSVLVVSEKKSNDDLLKIIDIDKGRFLKSMGINGMGPGEITQAGKLHKDSDLGSFWVYDSNLKIFSRFNVKSDSKLAIEQFKQPQEFYLAIDMLWSSDSSLMTVLADGNEKFVEYHMNGELLNTYGTWEVMLDQKDIPSNVIMSVHQGPLITNPDKSKFIKTGVLRDYMEILDKESGTIVSVRGPEHLIADFEVDYSAGYPMAMFTSRDSHQFYLSATAGKDYIYALYFGKPMSEYFNNGEYARTVMVFDYEGEIIRSYELDYSLIAFTVDEEGRRFFGITYDAEPNVVEFSY